MNMVIAGLEATTNELWLPGDLREKSFSRSHAGQVFKVLNRPLFSHSANKVYGMC